jgi:hypothetical protein
VLFKMIGQVSTIWSFSDIFHERTLQDRVYLAHLHDDIDYNQFLDYLSPRDLVTIPRSIFFLLLSVHSSSVRKNRNARSSLL